MTMRSGRLGAIVTCFELCGIFIASKLHALNTLLNIIKGTVSILRVTLRMSIFSTWAEPALVQSGRPLKNLHCLPWIELHNNLASGRVLNFGDIFRK